MFSSHLAGGITAKDTLLVQRTLGVRMGIITSVVTLRDACEGHPLQGSDLTGCCRRVLFLFMLDVDEETSDFWGEYPGFSA